MAKSCPPPGALSSIRICQGLEDSDGGAPHCSLAPRPEGWPRHAVLRQRWAWKEPYAIDFPAAATRTTRALPLSSATEFDLEFSLHLRLGKLGPK